MTFWDFLFASLEVFGFYAIATILFGLVIYFIGPIAWDYFISSKIELERSNLDLIKNNRGNVFNRLHERKLDAYTDLFSKMVIAYQKFNDYTSFAKIVPKDKSYEDYCLFQANEFNKAYNSLKESYHKSVILIPDEIDKQIERLFEKTSSLTKNYDEYNFYKLHGVEDRDLLNNALKKQLDARREIEIDFPKLLNEMRRTFRLDILKHD